VLVDPGSINWWAVLILRDFGMKLFAKQIGHQLVGITAMGAILGAWR
jgi:hypothetical protein